MALKFFSQQTPLKWCIPPGKNTIKASLSPMSCGFFGFRFHIVGYSAKAAKQGVQRLLNWRVTATSKLNSESYASQPGVEGGFLCSIRSWITMQKSKVFTETKNIANCSSVKKYVVAKTNQRCLWPRQFAFFFLLVGNFLSFFSLS